MSNLAPDWILEDEDRYAAAEEQAEQAEWTGLHELLAQQVEMTHFLVRQTMRGQRVKESDIPEQIRFERPEWLVKRRKIRELRKDAENVVSPGEAAKMFGFGGES